MDILVSILIPTYNQQEFVGTAIESALNQTYKDIEIVISDDASTDNTPEVVKRYINNKRVRYFRNEQNLGRVKNYRKALYEYATGDWVLNLDGDDYLYDKDYIEKAMYYVDKHEDIVLIGGNCIYRFIEDGYDALKIVTKKEYEYIEGIEIFLKWYRRFIPHLSTIYKRKVAMEIGFYKHDIISSDWESILRLLLRGNIVLMNKIAGVWVGHGENISRKVDMQKLFDNVRFITSPYNDAISLGIDRNKLNVWYKMMIKYYITSTLLILIKSKNISYIIHFYEFIKDKYPFAKKYFYSPSNIFILSFIKSPNLLNKIRKLIWKLKNFNYKRNYIL